MSSYEYLLSDISTIKGIGTKIGKLFRKKNINTIFDLLWNLPRDFVDRSNVYPINELQVGKILIISSVSPENEKITKISFFFRLPRSP